MKEVNIKSKFLLISMKQKLMEYLELANKIPEDDFRRIVLSAQRQKKYLKNITDNVERGNIFMMEFFIRELIESLLHSDD
jgi:hypothetical protein